MLKALCYIYIGLYCISLYSAHWRVWRTIRTKAGYSQVAQKVIYIYEYVYISLCRVLQTIMTKGGA